MPLVSFTKVATNIAPTNVIKLNMKNMPYGPSELCIPYSIASAMRKELSHNAAIQTPMAVSTVTSAVYI